MQLRIEIVLDGQQVTVHWPKDQPMHALQMLENARRVITDCSIQQEAKPAIESTSPIDLAQRLRNGRK